jgi:hypothetical protein
MNKFQEIAISTDGQLAQWELALEPLKKVSQFELDKMINRIDLFIFAEIEQATKGAE